MASPFVSSVCISAALPLVFYFLVMSYYGVPTSNAMYFLDFVTLAYLSSIFMLAQKNERLGIVPFVIAVSVILWSASYKYVLMGLWVRFADFSIVDEAWQVLSLPLQLGVLSLAAVTVGVSLYNLRAPSLTRLGVFLMPAVVAVTVSFAFPSAVVTFLRSTTHALYGNDPLYRSVPFAVGFDVLERWRFERQAQAILSRAPENSSDTFTTDGIENKRNVHMFVMESLMDPSILGIPLPVDPVDLRFRQSIGGSAVAPVLAGRSAQSEFELLCGTPVYDFLDPVTFNDLRGGPIPCLPRVLSEAGYVTLSSTDVRPNFFNALEAYRSLGFSRMHFRGDLPTNDLDGGWVSADAQIAFNKELIQPLIETERPFFNYIFFTTGHIPYALNPEKRPHVIETSSTEEVTRFVNSIHYNTRSVADYIEYLSEVDPDAIIVVVGDHQGTLPSIDRAHSGAGKFDRYITPYIFVDSGRVRFYGDLPHYELPHVVIASLAETEFIPLAQTYGFDLIRPLNATSFYGVNDDVGICPNTTGVGCQGVDEFRSATIARWLRLIQQSQQGVE